MKLRIIFAAILYNSLLLASAAAEKAKAEAPKAIADVPAAGAASASVAQLLTASTTASCTSVVATSVAKKPPLFFYKRFSTKNANGTTYTSTLRLPQSKNQARVSVEVVHKKNQPQPQATVKVVGDDSQVTSLLIQTLLSCEQRFIRSTLIKKQPLALLPLFEHFEAECTLAEEYSASAASPATIFCYTRSLLKNVYDERLVSSSKLTDKEMGTTVCSVTLFDLETPTQNTLDDSHIEGNALYMTKQLLQVDSSMVIKILSEKMPTALPFLEGDYEEAF